jgi:hypothetical protein
MISELFSGPISGKVLCDLIISAFSALEAIAEAPLAVLAVDVDGDDFFFDGGSRVLGSWGGVLGRLVNPGLPVGLGVWVGLRFLAQRPLRS